MKFNLLTFIILIFAAYRITRFFIIDSMFDGTRTKLHVYLVNKSKKSNDFWDKIHDLTSCTWCWGWWISLILYSLYIWECPINFNQIDVITVFAIAGGQGLLHAWEPEN